MVQFEESPLCSLIISVFDNKHVFDDVFDIDELSQNQTWACQQGRRATVDDVHDYRGGAMTANIEYQLGSIAKVRGNEYFQDSFQVAEPGRWYSSNQRADKPGIPEPGPARCSKSLKPGNLLYGMDYARPGGVDWGGGWASTGTPGLAM